MKLLEGHTWIGRRIRRVFDESTVTDGVLVGYWPSTEEDLESWHVIHEDNEEEDLEKGEVEEAFKQL